MFEKASRIKLRFNTLKGELTAEDLWDLPLSSPTGKTNLDDLACELDRDLKQGAGVSFVNKTSAVNAVLQLKFDIVIHVINTKIAERDAAALATANRERKQKIMAIIEQKETAALSEASISDLQKLLAEM